MQPLESSKWLTDTQFYDNLKIRRLDRKFNRLTRSDLPPHAIKCFTHQKCLSPGLQTVITDICLHLISICYRWAAECFTDMRSILRSGAAGDTAYCYMRWERGFVKFSPDSTAVGGNLRYTQNQHSNAQLILFKYENMSGEMVVNDLLYSVNLCCFIHENASVFNGKTYRDCSSISLYHGRKTKNQSSKISF